ncbi:hypothetical protein EBT31_22260, partial [bacterium]|nr:hypothetical protein [bacterium]
MGGSMSEVQTPPESHEFAQGIMGENFLGLAEVAKAFGPVSPEAQAALANIPFDEATLRSCRHAYVLVADIGLSIIDVRGRMKRGLFYTYDDAWYNDHAFAHHTEQVASWRLIRKTPVAKSANRSWAEQSALVGGEKIPPARQVTYAIMAYYIRTIVTAKQIPAVYSRTSAVPLPPS